MNPISRRDFLRLSAFTALGAGLSAYRPLDALNALALQFPDAEKIGRVTSGRVDIRAKPYVNAAITKTVYDDALFPWLREVVGEAPGGYGSSRWVETPDGYIYAPRLQPTFNKPNVPVKELPATPPGAVPGGSGKGMWAEVTVPYVNLVMRQPVASSVFREKMDIGLPPRLYYSMIMWVDDMETTSDGKVLYRVNERYGNPGDLYWIPAEAMRPLTEDDVSPISEDVENKKVVVNLTRQTLTCYEGSHEVYFCRVSTGAKFDADGNPVDIWSTPPGPHPVYDKMVSLHMSGRLTGDWPGVAWTQIFATGGVAIHSTYWHNYFGIPRSHGCVNCLPDDAQWLWRWAFPHVGTEPGRIDISSQWPPTGTTVEVIE